MSKIAVVTLVGSLGLVACRAGEGSDSKEKLAVASAMPSAVPSAKAAPAKPVRTAPKGKPLLVDGKPTGYEEVAEGAHLVRTAVLECPEITSSVRCPRPSKECTTDSDCSAKPHGHCVAGFTPQCYCDYGCTKDEECGAGSICVCDSAVGHCEKAECVRHEDCPEGEYCLSSSPTSESSYGEFRCRRL